MLGLILSSCCLIRRSFSSYGFVLLSTRVVVVRNGVESSSVMNSLLLSVFRTFKSSYETSKITWIDSLTECSGSF